MTTKLQRQVLEFHKVFGHPVADSPTIPADERVRFRAGSSSRNAWSSWRPSSTWVRDMVEF